MFKNILVAVDGSATSKRGLAEAIRLARDQGAALTILHVVDESWLFKNMGMGMDGAAYYMSDMIKDAVKAGKAILTESLVMARINGVKAATVLVEDMLLPVSDVIAHRAKKVRADLVVLGTHGRRGIRRLVMGSDAEGVLRQSKVPVLLVRAREVAAKRPKEGRSTVRRDRVGSQSEIRSSRVSV